MRTKFKLLVHESEGQKYEDLFVKIMVNIDLSFKPVKPHGNIGDRGNDGWCSNDGKYYQVYAPENLPSNTEAAIKKMKEDFGKLKAYWDTISPVRQYYFVVNDKFKGVSPHIYSAINELKSDFQLEKTEVLLSHQLENLLFGLNQDLVNSIIGFLIDDRKNKTIHQYLVDEITNKMHLKYWSSISENLIANTIEGKILDGFVDATILIFKIVMPNTIPSLEKAIIELSHRTKCLIDHFVNSPYAYLTDDNRLWIRDMRWKRVRIQDQDEYHRKYDLYENWRTQLYSIHNNLVHALNIFASEVRNHVYPQYFMGQQFTIVDSLGTYNRMEGYEFIPSGYHEIS